MTDSKDSHFFTDFLWRLLDAFKFSRDEIMIFDATEIPLKALNIQNMHMHESWEIKILTRGKIKFYFPGRTVELAGPVIALTAPGIIHGNSALSADGEMFVISFESRERWSALLNENGIKEIFLKAETFQRWDFLLNQPHISFLENVIRTLRTGGQFPSHTAAGLLRAFFATLGMAFRKSISEQQPGERKNILERATQFIELNYHDSKLTVAQVAGYVGVTPNHLAYVFKNTIGISPRRCLVEARLNKANRMLERGNVNIKEAAWLTGWKNQYYFSREFKRFFKYMPSALRRNTRPA